MKTAVICYAVHERETASFDIFDNLDEAISFVKEDAENTYSEENACDEDSNLTFYGDRQAILKSGDGYYIWTWEVFNLED